MGWIRQKSNMKVGGDLWAGSKVYIGGTRDVYLQRESATIISTPATMILKGGSAIVTRDSGTAVPSLNNNGEIITAQIGETGGSARLYWRSNGTRYFANAAGTG